MMDFSPYLTLVVLVFFCAALGGGSGGIHVDLLHTGEELEGEERG